MIAASSDRQYSWQDKAGGPALRGYVDAITDPGKYDQNRDGKLTAGDFANATSLPGYVTWGQSFDSSFSNLEKYSQHPQTVVSYDAYGQPYYSQQTLQPSRFPKGAGDCCCRF